MISPGAKPWIVSLTASGPTGWCRNASPPFAPSGVMRSSGKAEAVMADKTALLATENEFIV